MTVQKTVVRPFSEFFAESEPRLRQALTAALGLELTADNRAWR